MKLAVVTKNANLFEFVNRCFEPDGAACSHLSDFAPALHAIYRQPFNLFLVDVEKGITPVPPRLTLHSQLSSRSSPIVMLGRFDDRESIANAFDAGADDIVPMPVEPRELLVRVHIAMLRGQATQLSKCHNIHFGEYWLDKRSCVVLVKGEPVQLTSREFAIAWLLFSTPGRYVSRGHIANAVWGNDEEIAGRSLEQHVYKLRKKLGLNGDNGVLLRTMYAYGYRIEVRINESEREQP